MSLTNGPNLGLLINGNQGEAHYDALLAFFRGVDGLVMLSVKDKDMNTAPTAPEDGDRYIVGPSASGTWAWANRGKVVRYSSAKSAWEYFTPKKGWIAHVEDERSLYRHNGTGWELFLGPSASGWGAPTGVATRAAFDTATVTLPELAERVKALIDDLRGQGRLGS